MDTSPTRRLHMSEAIRLARQQQVSLVVVDITSDHTFELDEGEMELVGASPSTRPPSYAGSGASSSPARASRQRLRGKARQHAPAGPRQPRPRRALEHRPTAAPSTPSTINVDVEHHAVSATFAIAHTATMNVLSATPPDDLIDTLAQVLREYPEVEWACLVGEERAPSDAVHVALRIDRAFRKHLAQISVKLRDASAAQGVQCDVLVLDTPEQVKRARAIGLPFYPWRKR